MITFLVAAALLVWAAKMGALPGWGWWLILIVAAWFTDLMLAGAAQRAPRTPGVYDGGALVREAEERLARMKASTERTIEESDKVGAESKRLTAALAQSRIDKGQ